MTKNKFWSRIMILFVMLCTAFAFTSCGGDDDNNGGDDITDLQIYGTWEMKEVKMSASDPYAPFPAGSSFTFNLNHTFSSVSSTLGRSEEGTWVRNGKTITTTATDKTTATLDIISISATSVEIKVTSGSTTYWMKANKKL